MEKVERLSLDEARSYYDFGTVGLDGVIVPRYKFESPHKPELPADPDVNGFHRGTIRRRGLMEGAETDEDWGI